MADIDFSKLRTLDESLGDDAEDDRLIRQAVERGQQFLVAHDWCERIERTYVGDISVGGIVAVLLCEIAPSQEHVDEWLWVIAGDLPPAYLVTDVLPNPASALHAYDGLLREWVAAVRKGSRIDGLIPVHDQITGRRIAATPAAADELEARLDGLQEIILRYFEDDYEST